MSTWAIAVKDSTNTYISDETINRPNQDMETQKTSNTQVLPLADGSTVLITPSVKARSEPMTMFFANTTETFRDKISTYIDNADDVQITTHTGEIFTGQFTVMKRVWFVGIEDTYDIMVTFTRFYNSE